jgi:hypothetical protein
MSPVIQDHDYDDLQPQQGGGGDNPAVQDYDYDDLELQRDGGGDNPSFSAYARSLTLGGLKYTCVAPATRTSPYQRWVLTEASMAKFVFVTLILVKGVLLSFCHSCANATPETSVRQWLTGTPEQVKLLFQITTEGAKTAAALCCEHRCRHCAGLIKVELYRSTLK